MNWWIGLGVALNGLCAACTIVADASKLSSLIFVVQVALWLVSLLGIGLIAADERALGAKLVAIGSVFFIPVGLIGIYGARRVFDQDREVLFLKGARS